MNNNRVLENNVDDNSNPNQVSHLSMINDISKISTMQENDNNKTNNLIPLFLNQYTKYFQSVSKDFLFKYCTCVYFKNAEAMILEEIDKIKLKFDVQTSVECGNIIQHEIVVKNMKTIVEMESCGVVYMLKNKQDDDLKWMYNFLSSVNGGVKIMFDGMRPYFREVGTSVIIRINGTPDVQTCVQYLLDLKGQFDNLKVNLFNNDTLFDEIVGDEFDHFLNLNSSIPKYLSTFIDEKLRKGKYTYIKNNPEADIDKVIYMIKCLSYKAPFEHFYQVHLSNRLLHCKSVNMDNENKMISKLENAYGNGSLLFISKIKSMVKDKFVLSKTIMSTYKECVYVGKHILGMTKPFAFDLDVHVITPIYWSVNPKAIHEIPSFGMCVFNEFKTIYEQFNRKKKLMLLPQFGTVELNAIFYGKSCPFRCFEEETETLKNKNNERMVELVVTTYQMCVLDLFNDYNTLTYEEIQSKTKIPKESLIKALQDMMDSGDQLQNLLRKIPMGKNINVTDKFYVNETFQCI